MRAAFLEPTDSIWSDCLAQAAHDLYHLPAYARLCGREDGGQAMAFLAEEGECRLLVPLLVQPVPSLGRLSEGLSDAISPYGYPAPLYCGPPGQAADPEFVDRALRLMGESLRERRVVSAFCRLHPTLALPLRPFERLGCLVYHGSTVYIDLTLPDAELWRQTRSGHRNEINRARRNGQVATMDESWTEIDSFHAAYLETMRRVGAAPRYFFSREYLAEFRRTLGHVVRLGVVRIGGAVACAALFSEVCGIVQFHLAGTFESFLKHCPMKMLLAFVRDWAKQRGNRVFHLGGGLASREDSLFSFKAGFSHLRSPFHTWRLVADPGRYQDLVAAWERERGEAGDSQDGFFPAYRKPPAQFGPALPRAA